MRNTVILVALAVLGLGAWLALIVLVNSVSPNALTEVLFLGLTFTALSLTATPVAHAVSARWASPLGRRGDLLRALRQGALVGALGSVLIGLRFLRALTPLVALALTAAVVALEAMLQLRTR